MKKLGWALTGALSLAAILTLARVIQAGTLDPPGPVGATMRTLGDLVPSWSTTQSSSGGCASQRFSCVMGNQAVLDSETGLVWERTPLNAAPFSWDLAATVCTSLQTGGRFGWRLPAAEELLSVKDPSGFDGLPAGNPFSGVTGNTFWSATTDPLDESKARWVAMAQLASNEQTAAKVSANVGGAWCVRGGHGFDAQTLGDTTSWSKVLPTNDGFDSCSSSRFTCVFSNQAVLDHETGLVWSRSAQSAPNNVWSGAETDCFFFRVDSISGWRLPSEIELLTLLDRNVTNPSFSLPAGNPFTSVTLFGDIWWSSTELGTDARTVRFRGVGAGNPGVPSSLDKNSAANIWCVRAP